MQSWCQEIKLQLSQSCVRNTVGNIRLIQHPFILSNAASFGLVQGVFCGSSSYAVRRLVVSLLLFVFVYLFWQTMYFASFWFVLVPYLLTGVPCFKVYFNFVLAYFQVIFSLFRVCYYSPAIAYFRLIFDLILAYFQVIFSLFLVFLIPLPLLLISGLF